MHSIGSFYLISELGISGSQIKKDKGIILLGNTYVLELNLANDGNMTVTGNDSVSGFANKYSKNSKRHVERDFLEGRLAKEFLIENRLIHTIAKVMCNTQKEIYSLQNLVVHSFPELAHEIMFQEPGVIVENSGDAIVIKRCQLVLYDVVFWNQSISGRCFQHFPLKTSLGEV